jgi:two-component system, response regulator PdtaR
MIYSDSKLHRELTPVIQRVLILDPAVASARLLSELLKDLGARHIVVETSGAGAMAACKVCEPHVVFTDLVGGGPDGLEFVRLLRRSSLPCRQAPIIVVTSQATTGAIVAARNSGVHEFLRKPFTIKDLTRRLEVSTLRHRDWIEAMNYVGPDRRRFNSGDYEGPRKRRADHRAAPDTERIQQALKIMKSAIAAIDADPAQALRSMQAQAADLHKAAVGMADTKLIGAVAVLQRSLNTAVARDVMPRAEIEAAAAGLWTFMAEVAVEYDPSKAVA